MNLFKTSLPLMMAAAALGLGACNDRALPSTSSAVGAAPDDTGSTSDPATTSTCKASMNESGLPCKICVDGAGSIFYDDCGSGGSGGTGGTEIKCIPTTDPATGASCKTCYAPDGSYTATCAPPPSGCVDASGKNTCGTGGSGGAGGVTGTGGTGAGGTGATVKCIETTDPTGAACKTCYAADGSITTDTCSGGGSGGIGGAGTGGAGTTVTCAETTDPTTGAACKTCYAADGSITSNTCSGDGSGGIGGADGTGGVGGSGTTCVAAPNLESGQICKVCSDSASGRLLFVDCGPPTCSTAATGTTVPPAK